MPQQDPRIGEIYRHFKGNLYQITGIAIHSETREKMVVYQALYGDFGTYVRPYDMFISEVDYEKYPEVTAQYRFTLVNPATLRADKIKTAEPGVLQGKAESLTGQYVANTTNRPATTEAAPGALVAPATPTANTKAAPSGEESVYQHMIAFLDTDDFDKKFEILTEMETLRELSDHVIDNLAAALDVVIPDGNLDSRIDQLRICVRTRARYESTRLRG